MLQPQVEAEKLDAWLADVEHDAKQREDRIAEMGLSSGGSYSSMEKDVIEKSNAPFGLFERRSASSIQRKHAATITLSETSQDPVTRQLFGHVKAEIRADSLDLVAFILNDDSRFMRSLDAADAACVRSEVVATVNPHHRVVFMRFKAPGLSDRTFLNSLVAKQVAVDPPTYVVAVTPIPSHENILPKDEAGAVRAECYKSFRCAEVAPGLTELDYFVALDLKGWVPQIITDTIALPGMLLTVNNQQRYFQQIRPLAKCDADDGRIVGRMLLDLVEDSPKDLSHAIRAFSYRTAMLRGCSLRHIGAMLVRLLSTVAQGTPDEEAAITALEPSAVTEKQAIAIGSAIASSVHQAHALAAGLSKVVKSHGVLQAMKSEHAWFMPMLEVVMAHKAAERRGSMVMNRLRSNMSPVASSDVALHAGAGDEESGFSSVVRLGATWAFDSLCAHRLVIALRPKACFSHCRLAGKARHRRSLGMPKRARSSIRLLQSPLQLPRRSARLRMTRLTSEVNLRCRTLHNGGSLLCACCMVLCGLVQVPAAASSSSARDLPLHATRPEHQLPSYAWLDPTESIAVDSNQHDEAPVASSLARVRSRPGARAISVAAAEPTEPSRPSRGGGVSANTVAGL